ncbi:hypothetical protein [Bradyrhizobium sp. AUGA SZCCT0431]|nr:hypothetical protein [Bradyrhizobium sp. AUGA SZCCT0431]MBR1143324.1 hypothetical protein [Bradyrhizobium sp. AUGA SZCCT0431]
MTRQLIVHNKPVFDQLPPNIYCAAVGLVAWLSQGGFFSTGKATSSFRW